MKESKKFEILRSKKAVLVAVGIVIVLLLVFIVIAVSSGEKDVPEETVSGTTSTYDTSTVTEETEVNTLDADMVTDEVTVTIGSDEPVPDESELVTEKLPDESGEIQENTTTTPAPVTTPAVTTSVTTTTTTPAPETTVPNNGWLGAPEVNLPVPEVTTTEAPKETLSPEEKVGSIDPLSGKVITILKTEEKTTGKGLKAIITYYSDGTTSHIVECAYCHGFPCPDGGKESCSQYNINKDSTKTCQQCGRPAGDGYNGTCHRTIDWSTGVTTCNHYD